MIAGMVGRYWLFLVILLAACESDVEKLTRLRNEEMTACSAVVPDERAQREYDRARAEATDLTGAWEEIALIRAEQSLRAEKRLIAAQPDGGAGEHRARQERKDRCFLALRDLARFKK